MKHNSQLPLKVAFVIVPEIEVNSWDDVNKVNLNISEFEILNTGSVLVPRSGVLNEDKLGENSGLDEDLWVDVFAFKFYHKKHGWILIDTGLDSSYQHKGNLSGLLVKQSIKDFRQDVGQNIKAQLDNLEISSIYFTHLHADHTAGLVELNKNIPLYAGKSDQIANFPLFFSHDHFNGINAINEIDTEDGVNIKPFTSAIDIFGDQSFWAISTPGHSKSHLSYLLFTNEGPILLTGDACHTKYGFDNSIEPGWQENEDIAYSSLKELKLFKEMYPDTRIIYGHEM